MIEFVHDLTGAWLAWYNAGGFAFNTHQIVEYTNARTEVWANSKVNK